MKNSHKKIMSGLLLACATTYVQAEFNFEQCSGSGTFTQAIQKNQSVKVGDIPKDIKGLNVTLKSDKDVDIQLFDTDNSQAIVAWTPNNTINALFYKSFEETKEYLGTSITYSGYNGTDGNYGHEFIRLDGITPTNLEMKAFGYQSGTATVDYSWTGKVGCEEGIGEGNFSQNIPLNDIALVGEIPKNITNLGIYLDSPVDVDIQLYGEDGTPIVKWASKATDKGLLNGPYLQSVDYHDMHIEWSGYNGTNGKKGNEYIKVTPETTEKLTMKVFGFKSGNADVVYTWGNRVTKIDRAFINTGLDYENIGESQCGGTIDWQDVALYDGTLGVTKVFVDTHQEAVGQLAYSSRGDTVAICTGTLLANNTFITAGHCMLSDAQNRIDSHEMVVRFNYQKDASGTINEPDTYFVSNIIEAKNDGLDYAILQLNGNPTSTYAPAQLSTNISTNEQLTIIQHPNGIPKVIESGIYDGILENYIAYTDLDTAPGSSGSGVLNHEGKLVAVHTNAGCNLNGGANHGVPISKISEVSPFVANMLNINPDIEVQVSTTRTGFFGLTDAITDSYITVSENNNVAYSRQLVVRISKDQHCKVTLDPKDSNNWTLTDENLAVYTVTYKDTTFPARGYEAFHIINHYTFNKDTKGHYPTTVAVGGTTGAIIGDTNLDNNIARYYVYYNPYATDYVQPSYKPTLRLQNSIMSPGDNIFYLTTEVGSYNDSVNIGPVSFSFAKNPNIQLNLDTTYIDQNEAIDNTQWKLTENDYKYKISYIGNNGVFPGLTTQSFRLDGVVSPITPLDTSYYNFIVKELPGSGDSYLNTDSETAILNFN